MHVVNIPKWAVDRVVERHGTAHPYADLDPARTALVVVDMQNGFMVEGVAHALCRAAVGIGAVVVAAGRQREAPVLGAADAVLVERRVVAQRLTADRGGELPVVVAAADPLGVGPRGLAGGVVEAAVGLGEAAVSSAAEAVLVDRARALVVVALAAGAGVRTAGAAGATRHRSGFR